MIVDGWIIPEDQSITYGKGKQNDVDLSWSVRNRDEGTFLRWRQRDGGAGEDAGRRIPRQSGAGFPRAVAGVVDSTLKPRRPAWRAQPRRGRLAYAHVWGGWVNEEGPQGVRVLLQYARGPPGSGARGASHTAEISYMYGNPRNVVWTDEDKKLSDIMTSYWANFIATGDPNGKGLRSGTRTT